MPNGICAKDRALADVAWSQSPLGLHTVNKHDKHYVSRRFCGIYLLGHRRLFSLANLLS